MKRVLFLTCGFCWFMFALGFGFFLLRYVADGAGLQAWTFPVTSGRPVTAGSIMTGLVQGTGLFLASAFCLFVALGLWVHGLGSGRGGKS